VSDGCPLPTPYRILEATEHEMVVAAGRLFREYAAWLGVDLGFQGFEEELATLPGKYARPDGRLLLLQAGSEAVGCIALRRFDGTSGEVKRLYVQAAHHGRGLGKALARSALDEARAIGYRRLLLDTLAPMAKARALYRALGFREIAAYYANPLPGTVYMELLL
jgi:putative acetyltransferase